MLRDYLSKTYSFLSSAKNFFYDEGWADTVQLSIPVISVGNITVGGTGKTPFTDMLLTYLESKSKKALVISRNYKAACKNISKVDVQFPRAAYYFGDEPTWLAEKHPNSAVYVGPLKWKTALSAVQQQSYNVAIVDDGFQHRALHRNFEIVLMDATVSLEEYALVPKGQARDSIATLNRAHWVVFTKANLVDESEIYKKIAVIPNSQFLLADYVTQLPPGLENGASVILVSGLAQPSTFEQSIENLGHVKIVDRIHFSDHHKYTERDWTDLLKKMQVAGASSILTTTKDAIKLRIFAGGDPRLMTTELKLELRGDVGRFYQELDQIVG